MKIMKKLISILLAMVVLSSLAFTGCELLHTSAAPGDGVLNLYAIDPYTLDPATSAESTSHQFVTQIFSGLYRFDDDLAPQPDIAKSYKLSDDGKTYTFTLRPEAVFQDGKKLTAADVKYSWERACYPETQSTTAATYLGDIAGADDVLAGKAREMSGLRILDDYTLQVSIDAPRSYFIYKLAYPTSFIVDSADVAKGTGWWHSPNGSGPLKLAEWETSSVLRLDRNDRYYGTRPALKSVIFHLWSGVPMDLYETGQIDATGVGLGNIEKATDRSGPFYADLHVSPELSFTYIGFNTAQPPFDDANIRRAFSLAVDKEKIVSLVFKDMVTRADGILPPGMPGYNEALRGLEYNVAEARRLIAASKYGDVSKLPAITITTAGRGGQIATYLEALVYQWRENLGVEVTVRQVEPERFLYNLSTETDEMFDMAWIADYPHPQDFLDVLFHTGADINYGKYSNAVVDDLLDRAGVETDSVRSHELYRQAEQMLVDEAACLPLVFGRNYELVSSYVKGYRTNALGLVRLDQVSVESH
jgi:oligopeptide transport system substrate-binding protein